VYFISRYDQIFFHLNDPIALNLSDEELIAAARWCLTQDASEIFPHLVIDFLKKVGYKSVSERIKHEME
jgi:hypothetical protein